MITTETPYKLADIIRDTWPQLFISENLKYNKKISLEKNEKYKLD